MFSFLSVFVITSFGFKLYFCISSCVNCNLALSCHAGISITEALDQREFISLISSHASQSSGCVDIFGLRSICGFGQFSLAIKSGIWSL
jgi:hypothetical protein